jgi:hypothetical protein
MIVWSLNVVVAYQDGSWSSSNLTFDRYGFNMIGPEVSRLPEIKQFISQLGLSPVSGEPIKPVRKVVFRFAATATNGSINVLGDTETIDIISNNQSEVVTLLSNNIHFTDNLTAGSGTWAAGALLELNNHFSTITDLIPDKYCFWDDYTTTGEGGTSTNRGIEDGGDDMYDGANYLNTNLTQVYADVNNNQSIDSDVKAMASIPYTHTMSDNEDDDNEYVDPPMDGTVQDGTNYFGAGSHYFTNMYPGMFVMVAAGINITEFSVTGNIGSDGNGVYANAVSPIGTKNWTMFFKSIHDEGSEGDEDADPTINHIILVPGVATGLTQEYDDSNQYDDHAIFGLGGRNRLIFIVVATQPAAGPISESDALEIAQRVLEVIQNT